MISFYPSEEERRWEAEPSFDKLIIEKKNGFYMVIWISYVNGGQ